MNSSDIIEELHKASRLNGFSVIGLVVPIVGVICAPLAHARATRLNRNLDEEQRQKYKKEIHHVWSTSTFLLIVSLVSLLVWWAVLASNNSQSQQQSVQQQTNSVNNQASLNNCIEQNVKPLQNLAAIGGSEAASYVQNAQVALDSCKAEYPTN